MPRDRRSAFEAPSQLTGHALRNVCFQIPDVEEYRRAFWGHIYELAWPTKWPRADYNDNTPEVIAEYWTQILNPIAERFYDEIACDDPDDCKSYSPGAPFVQWFPNDPYNTPDYTPEGYNNPPWYLATTASNIALGSSTGDVITSIDRFPPGSLPSIIPASGLPRFRVNVSGIGRITIHLVNLIAGSLIQLTKDDDPFTVKFIDVSRDIVSLPPETMDAFQVEVEFDTPGLHWVDCIVVSWVNSSIPFLHHGGGLRQVDLCGFADMPLVPPTMIRSDPSGCGNLEKSTDGGETWVDIANTDYLRRDGVCAMTGGLEIYPTADEALLTLKGVGSPYQTAKIMRVQDSAGVDVAWINPRGDMTLNADASTRALTLASGGIGIQRDGKLQWKNMAGVYQDIFIVDTSDRLRMRSPGAGGFSWIRSTGTALVQIAENGSTIFQNDNPASATLLTVVCGLTQGSNHLFRITNRSAEQYHNIASDGKALHATIDAATNTVPDNLTIDHRSSNTPIAGFGSGVKLQGKSSTTIAQDMARLYAAWETPTHASRAAKVVLSAFDFSGEKVLLEGGVTGASTPKIGFLGAVPQPRLAITGDSYGIPALDQVIDALALFGLVTDASAPGTPPWATLEDIPAPYEPPLAIDVIGDWRGNEAGKVLSVALDELGIINDITAIGEIPDPLPGFLNLRCRAAATANWLVHQWYATMAHEMGYAGLTLVSDRWQYARGLANFDMAQQADLYGEWATQVFDEFMNGTDDTDIDAHIADVINYIPTIQEAFYCGVGDDGILTATGLLDIQTLLFADNYSGSVPQDTATWFYTFFKFFDAAELASAVSHALYSTYVLDVDCETLSCPGSPLADWCKEYHFHVGTYTPPFTLQAGNHVFGGTNPGWKSDETGHLKITFPFPTLQVQIGYNVAGAAASSIRAVSVGDAFEHFLETDELDIQNLHLVEFTSGVAEDGWYFEAFCNPETSIVTIRHIEEMQGTGIEPTSFNDCNA